MQITCAVALVGFSSVEKCASETLLDKSVPFLRCILSTLAKSCRALVPLQCSSPAAGSIFREAGWWVSCTKSLAYLGPALRSQCIGTWGRYESCLSLGKC